MSQLYSNDPSVIPERIRELGGGNDNSEEENISYGQALCSPEYKNATRVGIVLAVGQQLTGINLFMFYAADLL
jgi:hypothetical protein